VNRTVVLFLTAALCLFASPAALALADGGSVAEVAKKSKKHKKKKKRKRRRPATSGPTSPTVPGPVECVNDGFEPDAAGNARELAFTEDPTPDHQGVICPEDSDWFTVTIPSRRAFRMRLTPAATFDAELVVLTEVGSVVERVNDHGDGGAEETEIENPGDDPAVYFVEVSDGYPGESGGFSFGGLAHPAPPDPPCEGDDPEEQDDDPYSATVIDWPGTSRDLDRFLCPGDRDFFQITVPPGYAFQFSVSPGFDAALEVYDGGEQPIHVQDHRAGLGNEDVQFSNTTGSDMTRWIAVVGASPTETGGYTANGNET
jgi:hypothetical protein